MLKNHGVIWITGYSAAGKTTVGRVVERSLRAADVPTIFLDGDDLRSILGQKWGYSREERVELARVYFRLCSHLASQGLTVVICAVAMYDEVREWVRANVPNSLEIYLDVPEGERRKRDAATKKVYTSIGNVEDMYDRPKQPDLVVANHGNATPESVAKEIVDYYLGTGGRDGDAGRSAHWRSYYKKDLAPLNPSPFASHVGTLLEGKQKLLEVGCGNGRDAAYFNSIGHAVSAIDLSDAAIEYCRASHDGAIRFEAGGLADVKPRLDAPFDVVYSRFVIHAMNLEEEIATLAAAHDVLRKGGALHIECRSINDPMARLGEVISPTERIHGHYRRFIIPNEFVDRVTTAGFKVTGMIESAGLAVHKEEDPVVIRLSATRL